MNADQYYNDIKETIEKGNTLVFYEIDRTEVMQKSFKRFNGFMEALNRIGSDVRERVVILCNGYDHVPDELFDIKEVVYYMKQIAKRHPYFLYYVNHTVGEYSWILSSIADKVTYVKTKEHMKSPIEMLLSNSRPQFPARVEFSKEYLDFMYQAIIFKGIENGDEDNGQDIVRFYDDLL